MSTSVVCKTFYVTPPSGQYVSEPVNVMDQKACDQGQAASSEMNLLEMTDVEYTHLQHLIHSHMEVQDGSEEVRLNPPSSADHESENSSMACQPGASSSPSSSSTLPAQTLSSNQVPYDRQEVILYSDPSSISSFGETTPSGSGEIPSSVLSMKMRCVMEEARERNDRRRVFPLGLRPNPPARVCLEKRFNSHSYDLTKKHESQAAVLNTFLSMLQSSTDISGIAMHSLPEKWPKAETTVVDCASPYTGNHGVGRFSQLLEGNKHPEGVTSKNLPVSKSADSSCIIYSDTTTDEQVINIENEVVEKALKRVRTHRGRALQTRDGNVIPGSGSWRPFSVTAGRKPGRKARPPVELNQRKERHNLKERDRRRRIRLCCDELNTLVPFCYAETDKATTLQWTTAYLKYIREAYGDSLKQDFQNTFCGKTGVRIKPSCTNEVSECENSASK